MSLRDIATGMSKLTEVIRAGDAALAVRVRRVRLTVSGGPEADRQVTSSAPRLTVGSGEGNDLVLADPTISRIHLELFHSEEGVRVRDVGSTNGTAVNGVRVVEAILGEQATLSAGHSALRFELLHEQDELPLHPEPHFGRLWGHSVGMRVLFARLSKLAGTLATVLVEGESGTGKELIAEALHEHSPRRSKPFVVVDCGSIPSELVESELFGHEKGAFTGATHERLGAFEAADGGTLFLDELGELPLAIQPRLLRALERRQVKRVGSNTFRTVDVRFIAATHRDLRAQVNRGQFREDLYFRLAVAPVRVPPLRERPEDLPLLLERLWLDTGRALGLPEQPYVAPSPETLRQLAALPWEGNVRELRNFVERTLALGETLHPSQLSRVAQRTPAGAEVQVDLPYKDAKEAWLEYFEKTYLSERLSRAGGNVSQMAREAEVDRAHVIKLLRRYAVR